MSTETGNFPFLSQYKPRPKPQPVYPIVYKLDNGGQISAAPNVWIAAILASLEPKIKTEVLNKVSAMAKQRKSGLFDASGAFQPKRDSRT